MKSRSHTLRYGTLTVAAILTLILKTDGVAQNPPAVAGVAQGQRTFNFDLSQIKLPKDLQGGLGAALNLAFPLNLDQGGDEVQLSNPTVSQVTTPNPVILVGADVRYRKTKGFPKISTKGTIQFSSPVVARVTVTDGSPPMLVKAEVSLTDITVKKIRINNVPKWLSDSDAIAGKIEDKIGKEKSFDLTPMIQKFIQAGGKLVDAVKGQ